MRELRHVAVLGATGPTGGAIARSLLATGATVRAVSRSEKHLESAFGETSAERVVADIESADDCRRAIDGCDTVFVCVGFPLAQFDKHVTTARHIADAAQSAGSRVVLITGYWFQAPSDDPITAETAPNPSNPKSEIRLEQETIIREAGGLSIVLPDFYGPHAHGVLNDALQAILKSEKVLWPGNPEHLRDFVYVPDIAEPAIRLAQREEAFGKRWVIAGSGAMTPASLLKEAALLANKPLKLKMITPFLTKFASLFRADVRQFADVYPIYNAPATFDDSATRAFIGEWPVTSYDAGLHATIAWLRGQKR